MNTIQIEHLTKQQTDKIKSDLNLISLFTSIGKELGCRIIIHGGYAVDGALSQITRPHNDIDVQVYCQEIDGEKVVKTLLNKISLQNQRFSEYSFIDKKQSAYSRNFFVQHDDIIADIYYIQVKDDPFTESKTIVKNDGTFTEPHAYETFTATLNGMNFEAQDPDIEAAEKIYKREYRGDPKLSKHEQDINNLKQIVTKEKIEDQLQQIMNE